MPLSTLATSRRFNSVTGFEGNDNLSPIVANCNTEKSSDSPYEMSCLQRTFLLERTLADIMVLLEPKREHT